MKTNTSPITKVVFQPTQDNLKLVAEGAWEAEITWQNGNKEIVYRGAMPAIDDPKMKAAQLVYVGRKADQYTWVRMEKAMDKEKYDLIKTNTGKYIIVEENTCPVAGKLVFTGSKKACSAEKVKRINSELGF